MMRSGFIVVLFAAFFTADSNAASVARPRIDCRLVLCAPPRCYNPFPPPPGQCCPVCKPLGVCSLRPDSGPCKALFLRFFHDRYDGQCKGFIYGGCRGNGNNFRSLLECAHQCGCPDGQRPVNCFVDPCRFASCPAFPTAKCQGDYCGGCKARFFLLRRYTKTLEVTDKCNAYI